MTEVYSDIQLKINTGEDASSFGYSVNQTLNDSIIFTIISPTGKMIQFKSRTMKWLDGPQVNKYDLEIGGYSRPDALDWDIDVVDGQLEKTRSPYYDDGGACTRENGITKIADQPGVEETQGLFFEQGKSLDDMKSYDTKDKFRAISIIFANNQVTHSVQWSRTGKGEQRYYKVVVTPTQTFPLHLKTLLITKGYDVTGL